MDLVFDQNTGLYMRSTGTFISDVCNTVAQAYGQKNAFILPSGMSAIYNTLTFICREQLKTRARGIVLFSSEMYCDSGSKIIPLLSEEYPAIEFKKFDIYNQDILIDMISEYSEHLFAIFMESASNPNSQMLDWNRLRIPTGAFLIIDNTWLTPVNFNPFDYKADIVIDSCTKYLSGGQCIAGVVIFKGYKRLVQKMHNVLKAIGNHVSPVNCKLITNGVQHLEDTITRISNRTDKILTHLQSNPDIDSIIHPSMDTHPCYLKFKKYTHGYTIGIIYFHVRNPNLTKTFRTDIGSIVEQTSIKWHTSYGKSYDLFCRYCTKDASGVWLRLSIGYDDNPDIFNDLDTVCEKVHAL